MSKEGTGKVFRHGKAKTLFVSIPSAVATDSSFPFEDEETVEVKIVGKKIVVEKK